MSRSLALAAVATVAFGFAPRPATTDRDDAGKRVVADEWDDLTNQDWEWDVPRLDNGRWLCGTDFDQFERQTVEMAISADPIGRPVIPADRVGSLAIPLSEDFGEPAAFYPARGWRPHPLGERFQANGGDLDTMRAVALGLAWLARQQKKDGGWSFDHTDNDDRIAATGLALLAYIAVNETHDPHVAETKYYKTVAAGVNFLLKRCPPSGPRSGRFENTTTTGQAVATLALCEAYSATRDPALKPVAQAAVSYLQKCQADDGGWRDTPDAVSDTSVAGWVVQALHSARRTKDLGVDDRVIKKASRFLDAMAAGPRQSMYGTTVNATAKPGTASTATGLLCREYLDEWRPGHAGLTEGVAGLVKNPPSETNREPVYLYYATYTLFGYGGEDWKNWSEGPKRADESRVGGLQGVLIRSQIRRDGAALGSWDPVSEFGTRYGRVGNTALSVLTLEVYFRLPPGKNNGKPEAEPKK